MHASAVAPVGLAVSGNICQRQSLPHGVKVRLARACRVQRSSRNVSEGPPSSLSGWADVNWPGALGDVDGWGTFGVQGLAECSDPDFVSQGMCLLQRTIKPVLFDLAHLDCLNCFSSVVQISVRELLSVQSQISS